MTNILIKNATVKEINQALLRLQGADSNSGTTTNVTVRSSSSSSGGSSVNLSGVYSKIQTNAKNIASNTSSISLINTRLTEDEKSIKANTTNITKNTNNIASNSSKIGSIIGMLSTGLYTLSAGDTTLALKNNYTLTEQEVTVPYATAALNDSDGNAINDTYLKLTGGILTGDLTVNGNIYQNGSSYITHAEHLYSKDDLILTRDGATTGLSSGTYTGIEALLYDGTNNGYLVFDNSGTQLVGDEGSLVPLQTRDAEANMTDGKLVYWDATNKILKTSSGTPTGTYLPLSGGTMTGVINSMNILPKQTTTYNLGSSTYKYNAVNAMQLRAYAGNYGNCGTWCQGQSITTAVDGGVGYILLQPMTGSTSSGTWPKCGFEGRIYINRGSPSALNISGWMDICAVVAYNGWTVWARYNNSEASYITAIRQVLYNGTYYVAIQTKASFWSQTLEGCFFNNDNCTLTSIAQSAITSYIDLQTPQQYETSGTAYLPLTGGTMTGSFALKADQYEGPTGNYGLNQNNSDIVGLNGLFFSDAAENHAEGINWVCNSPVPTYNSLTASAGGLLRYSYDVQFGDATIGLALPRMKLANGFWGLQVQSTSDTWATNTYTDSGWIRTPTQGLLPYTNGQGSLGASTWKFANTWSTNYYGDNVYCSLRGNTNVINRSDAYTAGSTYYCKIGTLSYQSIYGGIEFLVTYNGAYIADKQIVRIQGSGNQSAHAPAITVEQENFDAVYGIQGFAYIKGASYSGTVTLYAIVTPYSTSNYTLTVDDIKMTNTSCFTFSTANPTTTNPGITAAISTKRNGPCNATFQTIVQPTFVGALSGNATTATTANNGQELYYKGKTTYTNTTTTYEKVVIGKIYPHSDTDILVVLRNNSGYRCKVWMNVNASLTSSVDYINISGHQDYTSTDFGAFQIGITAGEKYATLALEVACQTSTAVYIDVYAQDKQTQTNGYLALGQFTLQLQTQTISQASTYDYGYTISTTGQFIKSINGDTATFTTLNTTSARKYKKNIKEWKAKALDLIDKVDVVEYKYKSENDSNEKHIGFIADDTDKLLSGEKQDKMRIQDSIGVLIKAVQELKQLYTNIIEADSAHRQVSAHTHQEIK